ncbi:MAG: hypothetical protein HQK66_13670 [Desulfamplus sp.]|nr:hypothetical protein [Desulfamplus sp.]
MLKQLVTAVHWLIFTMMAFIAIVLTPVHTQGTQSVDLPAEETWQIYTSTRHVTAFLLSRDQETLWVGTGGGLEERDASTGQRRRLITTMDGLPNNWVTALQPHPDGGLWVGTLGGGVAHLSSQGRWIVHTSSDSELSGEAGIPSDFISSLYLDDNGGLWIGTYRNGFAYFNGDAEWIVYNTKNSSLPSDSIVDLKPDGRGGLWVAAKKDENGGEDGIIHISSQGSWHYYDTVTPDGSLASINSLQPDGRGGVWVGTAENGLGRLSPEGLWQMYDTRSSGLPDNRVYSLEPDGSGGIWVGTGLNWLAHMTRDGQWSTYNNMEDFEPPEKGVSSLAKAPGGGVWAGTARGLARLSHAGTWTLYLEDSSALPDNSVKSLESDGSGGLWIGTSDGLAHISSEGRWHIYDTDSSDISDNRIYCIEPDGNGGVWVGTWFHGLAHLSRDGRWRTYNTQNSHLPDDGVYSLARDPHGGVWVGTAWSGLVHISRDEKFTHYHRENSSLPEDGVYSLLVDDEGGVWIGTFGGGLAHLSARREWNVYSHDWYGSGGIPNDYIYALEGDGNGGIWVGTGYGLGHLSREGQWTVYEENIKDKGSGLPNNYVTALKMDSSRTLWIGTWGGVASLSDQGEWRVYDADNSGLPHRTVEAVQPDGNGGVWAGTFYNGLAYLSFSNKDEIAESIEDESVSQDILYGRRAAILIHPNGFHRNDRFAIETMAVYAYNTLLRRGFDHDEIYYLAHTPVIDINGDGVPDVHVVDAPVSLLEYRSGISIRESLTINDISLAFEWAKKRGKLDHPLYVIFVGHGLPERLRLDNLNSMLPAPELQALLDDYQNGTGNGVVAIVEACHSGTLVPVLSAHNRVLITSTGDTQAVYTDNGMGSFSRLFFSELGMNQSIYDAFTTVSSEELPGFGPAFRNQVPQIDDDGDRIANHYDGAEAGKIYLNGNFGTLDVPVILMPRISSRSVISGETLVLEVEAGYSSRGIREVWAAIQTPESTQQRDALGHPLVPETRIPLTSQDGTIYKGSFSGFHYRGDYGITFMAQDRSGLVSTSSKTILSLLQGPEVRATPVPSQPIYHDGDPLKITIPHAPEGISQYLAALVPGLGSLVLFTAENSPVVFDGVLHPFAGTGDTALDLPDASVLPGGTYTLFLLRAPAGSDPMAMDVSEWVLGQSAFEIE